MIAVLLHCAAASSPALQALGASPEEGALSLRAKLGYPWRELHVQWGLSDLWGLSMGIESAAWKRQLPYLAARRLWHEGASWTISGELGTGWIWQEGVLQQSGPQSEMSLLLARSGKVTPYLSLGMRGMLYLERETLDTMSGIEERLLREAALTLTGDLGLGWSLGQHLVMDVGMDLDWVEVPSISIPGLYLALSGGRRR